MTTLSTQQYGPWAVIAGAAQGIGQAFAEQLAAAGFHLYLIDIDERLLNDLAERLGKNHGIQVQARLLDLASPELADQFREIADQFDIGLLIYNACYSEIGPFIEMPLEGKLKTLDVNCRGPVIAASVFGDAMKQRGRGGLIFMSSLSGYQGTAMVSTYAATKAFDTILAESLWEEFAAYGVDVLAPTAGATLTPKFQNATPKERQHTVFPMEPEQVARQALTSLGKGPTTIPGIINRLTYLVFQRLLPRKWGIRFISNATRNLYDQSR